VVIGPFGHPPTEVGFDTDLPGQRGASAELARSPTITGTIERLAAVLGSNA
jgi:hypothetical protein